MAYGTLATQVRREVRSTHAEKMTTALERVALGLFARRGFASVTVDEIAAEAQVSVRTFYRYLPQKEQVLHVRIDRRAALIAEALARRTDDEAPLRAIREALTEASADEDEELVRQWVAVIAATPELVPGVIGGMQLKVRRVINEYLALRLDEAVDAFVPKMLAAAVGGIAEAATTYWFADGGDLSATMDAALELLEPVGSASALWTNKRSPQERSL